MASKWFVIVGPIWFVLVQPIVSNYIEHWNQYGLEGKVASKWFVIVGPIWIRVAEPIVFRMVELLWFRGDGGIKMVCNCGTIVVFSGGTKSVKFGGTNMI